MKKLIISFIIMLTATTAVIAQNEVDALRFSRLQYGGSARYWGLGGAYGAVGADFSALSTNPAGMGLFKRSEISFTPTFTGAKSSATFYGTTTDDSKSSFNIGNLGVVFVIDNPNSNSGSDWKNFQFGFGYNRLANFNSRYLIKGTNTKSSLLGKYKEWADGNAPDNLNAYDTKLAFDANLLYRPDLTRNIYSADVLDPINFPGIDQMKTISTTGYMGETVFSGSGNYQDKIYFGASLGILSLRYDETTNYTESDKANRIPAVKGVKFNSFDKYESLLLRGTGYNLKLGVIVRAADWLRLGAAVHTPALFSKVNYDYNTSIASYLTPTNYGSTQAATVYSTTFDLTTPLKLIGSAAFIIGKSGLISVDYEMVDYSKARFQPSVDYTLENQRIKDKYQSTSNIRVGGEYRVGQISLRGGYGIFGSPYKSNVNDGKGTLASLGIGYRTADYYVDCAYTNYKMAEDYYLYGGDPANSASLKSTTNMFMVTFGLKF